MTMDPVQTVFSCVASRKREVGARRILPSSRAGFLCVKTFCAWPAGLLNFGG
jgi:hypothetical protein